MPCCTECNGSRSNKPIMEFVTSDPKYQSNITFFKRIIDISNAHVKHYRADDAKYQEANDYIRNALYAYRKMIQEVAIYEL